MIKKNQKRQNLKNNHILILNQVHLLLHHVTLGGGMSQKLSYSFLSSSTSPSCHTCQAHPLANSFLSSSTSPSYHTCQAHTAISEKLSKNNYILILNQAQSLLHHVTLGGAMSQNEMEIFQALSCHTYQAHQTKKQK